MMANVRGCLLLYQWPKKYKIMVLTNCTKFNKINLNEVGKYDGKCSGGGRCCSIRRAKKLKIVCWFWKSSQCLTKLLCGKCEWRGWKLE